MTMLMLMLGETAVLSQETVAMLSQFGVAGLIGMLWVVERRHAAKRDAQLDEAHRDLRAQQQHLQALLDVVKDNTQAIQGLKAAQERLIALLERPGAQLARES